MFPKKISACFVSAILFFLASTGCYSEPKPSDRASSESDNLSKGSRVDSTVVVTKVTAMVDFVPLNVSMSTLFVLDTAGELGVFRYTPQQLLVNEVRIGIVEDKKKFASTRATLSEDLLIELNQHPDRNMYPLDGDQFKLTLCYGQQNCLAAVGMIEAAPPSVSTMIDKLHDLANTVPVRTASHRYLRCEVVPDTRWQKVKRRGVYRLTDLNTLPDEARLAAYQAAAHVEQFKSIDCTIACVIGRFIVQGLLFFEHERRIFSCQVYGNGETCDN